MPSSKRCAVAVACLVAVGFAICLAYAAQSKASFSLDPLSPQFSKLIAPGTKLETIATGFGFTEGPVWDPGGFLWVSDETINKIYKVQMDGAKKSLIDLGDPDGNTLDRNGFLIDCASVLRAIISISRQDGRYTVLADRYEGKRFNSPNDVVYGPDGALYFTDPPFGLPKRDADPAKELSFNGVFRFAKGKLQLLAQDLAIPNGIAFSPDYKLLYLSNSENTRRVWTRCDVGADGDISNCRVFADATSSPDRGVPDGMKVDSAGNVYGVGPGGLWVFSPAGKHLGTIRPPESPSSCAWGDDGKTLYITARTSIYKVRVNVAGEKPFYNN